MQKAAIKKMDMQASREFLAELKVLTHVHHLNLVLNLYLFHSISSSKDCFVHHIFSSLKQYSSFLKAWYLKYYQELYFKEITYS